MKFGGGLWELDKIGELTEHQVRTMPMMYRASIDFALQNSPILGEFIDNVKCSNPPHYKYESLDVKVAMLKKGWWPCIPGWHCDDFYRPTGEQPDIEHLPEHNSIHYMALFGDCSLTQFLEKEQEFCLPPQGATVYGFYDKLIEESGVRHITLEANRLYRFTALDFHRGMPATKDGWRAFIRLTLGNEREPKNEIRSQVQVYVPTEKMFAGW